MYYWQREWNEEDQLGAGSWGNTYRSYIRWPVRHLPYLKNEQVFRCPSDKVARRSFCAAPGGGGGVPFPASYGVNLMIMCYTASPVSMAQIQFPTKKIFIAEASTPFACCENWNSEYFRAANWSGGENGWSFSQMRQNVGLAKQRGITDAQMANVTRHQLGNYIIYCDGHVKWTRWNSVGDSNSVDWRDAIDPLFDRP